MAEFQNILTGTDFSEHSEGSVREAIRLAVRFDGTLHVLHVLDKDTEHEATLERIRTFVAEQSPPEALNFEAAVQVGGVSEGIAAHAEAIDADLVCIGPRARGFVEKHFTGGPAEQLIRSTRRPTLITHTAWDQGYSHILVPVGLSKVSAQALRVAASLVEGQNTTIRLLHVLSGAGHSKLHAHAGSHIEDALIDEAKDRIAHFVKETLPDRDPSLTIETEIHFGAVSRWILDVAQKQNVDLVCIGTVGRKGLSAFFAGNTAGSLVRRLPCPMLVAYP